MENISRPLGALKLARQLNECMVEKEALERQVEELKAQLQKDENHSACQEEKVQELTTKLERQMVQIESLQWQVDDYKQREQMQEFEHSMRLQLIKELEETKEKLAYQKKLEEVYIKRGRETCNDHEIRIVNETAIDIKKKQKKELVRDLERLKVDQIINQQKFIIELQVEKDQNEALKQELEGLKVSHQISLRSVSAELMAEREVIDSLQKQLKEIQSEASRLSEMLELTRQQNNEKDTLLQQKDEEIQVLEKNAVEKEKHLLMNLQDLKEKVKAQVSAHQELSTELWAEQTPSPSLQNALAELKNEQKDRTSEQEREKSEEKLENERETLSLWERLKLHMGFRKE